MLDAYNNKLKMGDQIIYSTGGSSGTLYHIGKIVKLYPSPPNTGQIYTPPDRVAIEITETSGRYKFNNNPIVYASNVVLIKGLTPKKGKKS